MFDMKGFKGCKVQRIPATVQDTKVIKTESVVVLFRVRADGGMRGVREGSSCSCRTALVFGEPKGEIPLSFPDVLYLTVQTRELINNVRDKAER